MSLLPPPYQDEKNSKSANGGGHTVGRRTTKALKRVLVGSLAVVGGLHIAGLSSGNKGAEAVAPLDASILSAGLAYCDALYAPKPCFGHRLSLANERADPDEPAYLLRNATIYTANGEVIEGGDILIQDGLIKKVARKSGTISVGKEVEVIDVGRAWVTPGIVDLHSHMGVYAAPSLSGNADGNSIKSPILPYLRSIDGFSTADLAFANSIAGGITSMQVLPGSANNVGGEAFFFKPRHIKGGSPSDMALEPAFVFNGNGTTRVGGRNRRSKHAQGENIMRVHSSTRMDQGHWFRQAYEAGRKQMVKEDVWCAKGKDNTEPFPTDLDNEMLADTIRGNVKVNVHSYQTVDFDLMARLTNEFKFHVSAIHHAHEAYLVPDLLKKYYGGAPAVAGFAVTARYKWESMRGSEFASSILAEAGITNIMKSDHPVLDSRYLMWEAAQAHHYGLNWTLAMDAVFSAPARTAGLDHRIGFAVEGHDADLVIWDSMPLSLGATPAQVFIDGVKQLKHPHVVAKPGRQDVPRSRPDSHQRAKETRETGGNLSYAPRKTLQDVVFINVRSAFGIAHDGEVEQTFGASYESADWANFAAPLGSVVVRGSEIVCSGACDSFAKGIADVVDLAGGSLLPGLVGYGPALGVSEIAPEKSTVDGNVFDLIAPAVGVPDILKGTIIKGSEALSLGGKELQIIHHAGILTAFAHPTGNGLVSGLSSAFRTGAENVLSSGAIVAEVGALHSALAHGAAAGSISEQIRALKLLLLGGAVKDSEAASYFAKVAKGEVPLVVAANKADHIAGLINMKRAVDKASGSKLKLVIEGGLEAHLLVDELAKEEISVIVPPRSYPGTWDTQRIIAGPPLTEHTLASLLTSKGVIVGIGHGTNDVVRQARFDALWNYSAVPSVFSPASAIALVSANLYKMLGVKAKAGLGGFIAVEGDVLNMGSRVVAALDNGHIELF